MPRISVLMPVYNAGGYLLHAIESVLSQTFREFELLIIDDGSTDGSLPEINKVAKRDRRIRVLHSEVNTGLGGSLALGVESSRGAYVARMDADDLMFANRLERQTEFMEAHPYVDILGAAALEIDEVGRTGRLRSMPRSHDEIVARIWACPLIHPTIMFRRHRILAAGNYCRKLRRQEDYELWFRCVRTGLTFANLPDPLVYYRFGPHSHSRKPLRLALQQARIGIAGCRMLDLPWWQRVGATLPVLRAVLPRPLQHHAYRIMGTIDPRRLRSGDGVE